jgi:opacity protein-like surface antigen
MNDVAAAYQCAIRWKVTGDEAYAEKAIQILNAWASTCKKISGNSNIALAAGIYGYQFANAAEILRDYKGWTEADFNAFKQWMLDVFYSVSHRFLETHWGTCNSHYWANWDLANLANVMSIGVLCDRVDLYKYAIDYLMDGVGNGNIKKAINFIHPKSGNDDIDLGQLQESGRDQGHSLLCIGLLGTICQIGYNQGEDLYAYDDNRVLKAAEYAAKYNYANLSVPFSEYTRNYKDAWSVCGGVETHTTISDHGKGGARPIWEILYNHYVVKKGMKARYVTMAAQKHRAEGGGGDFGPNSGGFDSLGFGTLMHSLEK